MTSLDVTSVVRSQLPSTDGSTVKVKSRLPSLPPVGNFFYRTFPTSSIDANSFLNALKPIRIKVCFYKREVVRMAMGLCAVYCTLHFVIRTRPVRLSSHLLRSSDGKRSSSLVNQLQYDNGEPAASSTCLPAKQTK